MTQSERRTAIRYYTSLSEDAELADWQRAQALRMIVRLTDGEG